MRDRPTPQRRLGRAAQRRVRSRGQRSACPADAPLVTDLVEAERAFLARYPEYAATGELDALRRTEYGRLDRSGHVYLDYTGGGLYAASQVRKHAAWLLENTLGNPHSNNPTSLLATRTANETRERVLRFFRASPEEYAVAFTANATGALKLVAEAYPFTSRSTLLLTFDNHNSVVGIREYARARGARTVYAPLVLPDLRLDEARWRDLLSAADRGADNLFAYPAQSNFSGVQHDLGWIDVAREQGWDTVLDAAAFVPTNRLDLSRVHPDFVAISFYKMFGYPTGVGALIARREALAKLQRPWFSGGTITVASVQGDRYYLSEGPEAFEDGTINYLSLAAVSIGLDHLEAVGLERIHSRVICLAAWLLETLASLRHASGRPLIQVYGPLDMQQRGATVTINVFDPEGHFVDHRHVEERANRAGISLRTGCFCNPGGGETALGLSATELITCFASSSRRLSLDDFRRCLDAKSTGAVRVSLGVASNFADAAYFVDFVRSFLDRPATDL